MNENNNTNSRFDRRTVLKKVGATSLAGGSLSGVSDATAATNNKDVFVESGASYTPPPHVNHVHSLSDADMAVFAPQSQVRRKRIVDFIQQYNPISFAGRGAEEALHSVLYNIPIEEVTEKFGSVPVASGLEDYSFGTEYLPMVKSSSAVVIPVGDIFKITVYRGKNSTKKTTKSIHDAVRQAANTSVALGEDKNDTCYSSKSGWECLGEYNDSHPYEPYGKYKITVQCVKNTDESDPNNQYISLPTKLATTPGEEVNDWNSSWENDEIYRLTDYDEDIYELEDVGPDTSEGSESNSISVSLATSKEAGVEYGYEYTKKEVAIDNGSDPNKGICEHTHTWSKNNTDAAESYASVQPSSLVNAPESEDELVYYLDEYWRWEEPSWGSNDTFTVNGEGTGYWNI